MLMSFDSAFFRACLDVDSLSYHFGDAIDQRGLRIPQLSEISIYQYETMVRVQKIAQ